MTHPTALFHCSCCGSLVLFCYVSFFFFYFFPTLSMFAGIPLLNAWLCLLIVTKFYAVPICFFSQFTGCVESEFKYFTLIFQEFIINEYMTKSYLLFILGLIYIDYTFCIFKTLTKRYLICRISLLHSYITSLPEQ